MHVLLIPGLWLDGSSWDAVVPALEHAGHHPHALTLPGMEAADADRAQITLRDHVKAVIWLIDSLGPAVGKVGFVGHSAGAAIAYAAAGMAQVRELAAIREVQYVDLPTGHWPQFTRPAELARAILASLGPA